MAIIYLDRFESILSADMTGDVLPLPATDVQRIVDAMAYSDRASPAEWGRFAAVPLFVGDELVLATHPLSATSLAVERPEGGWGRRSAGEVVRCAPPATVIAAGHLMTRGAGTPQGVIVRPGERSIYMSWESEYSAFVAQAAGLYGDDSTQKSFTGDDWPSELVVANGRLPRTLNLLRIDGQPVAFHLPGIVGAVTSMQIPDTCEYAVITIRKIPHGIRNYGVQWLVSPEFYG